MLPRTAYVCAVGAITVNGRGVYGRRVGARGRLEVVRRVAGGPRGGQWTLEHREMVMGGGAVYLFDRT
jgi:hypothetical protein